MGFLAKDGQSQTQRDRLVATLLGGCDKDSTHMCINSVG
jgi:hypothetical protein